MRFIVIIMNLIWVIESFDLNGCRIFLYWFREMVVRVRDEEVERNVVVGNKNLYGMELKG